MNDPGTQGPEVTAEPPPPSLFPSPVAPERRASFSEDRRYRYTLHIIWDSSAPPMTWVMLNPSTADEVQDDTTIRRCQRFARREGCGGVVILNLFALRSTDPDGLLDVDDPHGPINDSIVGMMTLDAKAKGWPVVAAWGAWPHVERSHVYAPLANGARDLLCLGTTKGGAPRHPLYVAGAQPLEPWKLS